MHADRLKGHQLIAALLDKLLFEFLSWDWNSALCPWSTRAKQSTHTQVPTSALTVSNSHVAFHTSLVMLHVCTLEMYTEHTDARVRTHLIH